jgi:hypothetical protein
MPRRRKKGYSTIPYYYLVWFGPMKHKHTMGVSIRQSVQYLVFREYFYMEALVYYRVPNCRIFLETGGSSSIPGECVVH